MAGNASTEANAVFVGACLLTLLLVILCANVISSDPFAGEDLSTIDQTTQDGIETMRLAAESAETGQFDPEIAAATGITGLWHLLINIR